MQTLSTLLLQQVDSPSRAALSHCADLEQIMSAQLASARAAWPGVRVTDQQFVAYVAARLSAERTARLAELPAADLYLACACEHGDREALLAFERHFFPG